MNIEHFSWYSDRVGKTMNIMRYGESGPPMLYYPTSGGGFTEFDYYRLQDNVYPWTEAGKVQFFSVDGYNHYSWQNSRLHPADRVKRHIAYESFILEEVIPFMVNMCQNDFVGCMGASFGGYYAANSILKYPNIFRVALALGGVFDIGDCVRGYHDDNVYFNNPVEYVQNLNDQYYINLLNNHSLLVLMLGDADKFKESTYSFHNLLDYKGIRHVLDVWPAPCDHHEYWWKKQIPAFLEQYYS